VREGGQLHDPDVYPQGKRPAVHCTEGSMGHRVSMDGCRTFRPPPGFVPRTVQAVEHRYTDSDVPANVLSGTQTITNTTAVDKISKSWDFIRHDLFEFLTTE
jgi:hypothetical protein